MRNTVELPEANSIPGYRVNSTLCDSPPHVLYRATRVADGTDVVIKTLAAMYPNKKDVAALQREHRLMSSLDARAVPEVIDLVAFGHGNVALVLEPFGCSLRELRERYDGRRVPLDVFFRIARNVISVCGSLHHSMIVHKNLEPGNILVDPATFEVRVIDLDLSSELSREHQESLQITSFSASTLPFISPEQTGRINRDIDYRSDFYTLGVTFYELLTGMHPYTARDPVEWVYHAISVQPIPPSDVVPEVPRAISSVVMKLLSKNAEDRYQSIRGIEADLQFCEEHLDTQRTGEMFAAGAFDSSDRFQIPQRLYGRESEVASLEHLFERAASGRVEFCLVAGYSGVGKTALVQELGRSIVQRKGYLIHGKFEQYRQNAAYSALGQAFRDLLRQILGEPSDRLQVWASELRDAIGDSAGVISDLLPELTLILGEPPIVPDLPPAEAQLRFQLTFLQLVKVFARPDHPLVIFLDDLQWSDIPTLHLISRLVTSNELSDLFLIGAYRDNEVDPTHPLTLILREIEARRPIEVLQLQPMDIDATNRLISDTLLCDRDRSQELSRAIYEKTAGNPFFTIELLKTLRDRDSIFFDQLTGRWEWDMASIQSAGVSENVIDILVDQQHRLPDKAQTVLQLGACIGTTFDLRTLSVISQDDLESTSESLIDALKMRMIVPMSDSYKLVISTDPKTNPVYAFQHDRIQQASYSLIDPSRRSKVHLDIGRLMLDHVAEADLHEQVIEIVAHLNIGRDLITDVEERRRLARLDLQAGMKAKRSSAYASALQYLSIGFTLLGETAWSFDRDLAWALATELQHCYYLTGDRAAADRWSDILLERSATDIERGTVLANRTRQYATTGRMQESIESATIGLSILGFPFIPDPSSADVARERALLEHNLAGRDIGALIEMPEITDEKARIASQLIMEIFPAAFLSASGDLFPYLVLKSANVAIEYGSSPESAFAYVATGMILCGIYEDTVTGYAFGKLGVEMIDRFEDISLRSRIIYVYAMFVHHWREHWSTMTPWFKRGIEAGYQSGDLLYLAYSAQDCVIWDPTLDLDTATQEHRRMLAIVAECEYQDSLDSGTLFLQMLLNFQGLTRDRFSMTDDTFDEERCVAGMNERRFMTGISNYHIYKAEIHALYNDPQGALPHVEVQEARMNSVLALPQAVRFRIVAFLVRASLLPTLSDPDRADSLSKMQAHRAAMQRWAEHCETNFLHLLLLMDAELAAIGGNFRDAIDLFDRSIAVARKNGFQRDEAVANERAGRYLVANGMTKAADGYLRDAHYLFYRWGAYRKVEEMERTYRLAKIVEQQADIVHAAQFDMASVLKASQVISGELVLDRLLRSTLEVLIENAGAQHGTFIEERDGVLTALAAGEFPTTLVNMALRTGEPIVVDNAQLSNPFSSDPYFATHRPLSILCVPLPSQGTLRAAVYFENDITQGAFTTDRVEVIKLLARQASISMENARIYEQQDRLLKAQQRFVPRQFLSHLGHTDIGAVELGESVSMEMSVLFSDIREFTPLVESLSPQDVIQLLNRFYSKIGVPITSSGGFIDSYAGDGIIALFAVPAQQAVAAAVGMARALTTFNADQAVRGQRSLRIGIGINTGPLVLGTMGGDERMQCSVLGDTVNLAARIEQLTRLYDAQCLVGEPTLNALDDPSAFTLRLLDRVAVKGKDHAVRLYEVLDAELDERRFNKLQTRSLYESAFEHYTHRRFSDARTILLDAISIDPQDRALSVLLGRVERYLTTPPPDDWQGFERLEHK